MIPPADGVGLPLRVEGLSTIFMSVNRPGMVCCIIQWTPLADKRLHYLSLQDYRDYMADRDLVLVRALLRALVKFGMPFEKAFLISLKEK